MEFIPKSLAQLHRGLLVSALQVLSSGERRSCSEVLQWVFPDPDACTDDLPAIPAQPDGSAPFLSFVRCCHEMGLDPESLRERLLRVLVRLGRRHTPGEELSPD